MKQIRNFTNIKDNLKEIMKTDESYYLMKYICKYFLTKKSNRISLMIIKTIIPLFENNIIFDIYKIIITSKNEYYVLWIKFMIIALKVYQYYFEHNIDILF